MPKLDDSIHLDMLRNCPPKEGEIYGMHWGDPEMHELLRYVVTEFIDPYLNENHVCVEIGPGGGRWTRYLTRFKKLYAIDYYQELLDILKCNYGNEENIVFVKNNGTDFPSIPNNGVDFIFSFGTFVHLDVEIIGDYIDSMRRIMHENSVAFIQYSDKTKAMAQVNKGFSNMTPEVMLGLLHDNGFEVIKDNRTLLQHSSIVLFRLKSQ